MKKVLPWLMVGGLIIVLLKEYWPIILILGIIILISIFLVSDNENEAKDVKRDLFTDAVNSYPKEDRPFQDNDLKSKYSLTYNTSLINHNLAFIDFETANKERGSAVQLGITTFKKGVIKSNKWFFKPYRTNLNKEFMFTYLHGITPVMVIDKPYFHEVWDEIYKEIEGCVIVAHNASFDLGILDYMFERKVPEKAVKFNYICTLELARKHLKGMTYKFSLEHLCKKFKLPYGNHDGREDALSCMHLLNLILNYSRSNLNHDKLLKGKKWVATPRMITTSITIGNPA